MHKTLQKKIGIEVRRRTKCGERFINEFGFSFLEGNYLEIYDYVQKVFKNTLLFLGLSFYELSSSHK
jgi:hypothetical protein